ncbi:beta-flanking protein [Coprinopsis cinerea okayama7|uniref:Beta-flanking protein n=1 Tax=Coprinopsis cinerea (strain Okayama-7 / 130 / ATCC MYA-4618 / FGSC 9003) TaxID=240176 RepID=A8N2S5_COPC7|nr:beta-flanking protein [Coprinopsis cinerea okayama7\|eukprot:XP_001829147.2 beta-flanking protein [Coprinopsis cinerea okayama7\
MDSFMNLAKKGLDAYNDSQSNVSKTGGQELNSPSNNASSGLSTPPINQQQAVENAAKNSSGETSLFDTALKFLTDNKSSQNEPLNDDEVTKAHEKVYKEGKTSGLSANLLGSAAALEVLKKFTGGSSSSSSTSTSSSGGNTQTQLISLAMAEAAKLFDKSDKTSSNDKQDAVNGAAMTIMKLLVQSKFGGAPTTGGSDSGGLGGLLSLASKLAK